MNPLIGMMKGMGGMGGMGNPMAAQIMRFAGLIGARNPRQMVMNLMKQRGISDSELEQTIRQAREIARSMGVK